MHFFGVPVGCKFISMVTCALSMASSGFQIHAVDSVVSAIRVKGAVYHLMGPLQNSDAAQTPKFAQVYVIDDLERQLEGRLAAMRSNDTTIALYRDLLRQLQTMLIQHNEYACEFCIAAQVTRDTNVAPYNLILINTGRTRQQPLPSIPENAEFDGRRYNALTSEGEVAGVMPRDA
jgi:hypothetical protein